MSKPNTIIQYRVLFTVRELVGDMFADVQHSTKWFNTLEDATNSAWNTQEKARIVSRDYVIKRRPNQ